MLSNMFFRLFRSLNKLINSWTLLWLKRAKKDSVWAIWQFLVLGQVIRLYWYNWLTDKTIGLILLKLLDPFYVSTQQHPEKYAGPYLIIVADAVSVNFSGRCKFWHIQRKKLAIYCVFCRNKAKNWQFTVYFVVIYAFFRCKFYSPKILPV